MASYTYSIFDADPNSSSGTVWPGHDHAELKADDADSAAELVEQIMADARYNEADGYDVGQTIYALVWDADDVIVAEPTHEIATVRG